MADGQHAQPRLALYEFESCPYCALVRRAIDELAIDIERRNILQNRDYRRELIAGGGRSQVPCLRLDHADGRTEWLYESADIIAYLRQRFGQPRKNG